MSHSVPFWTEGFSGMPATSELNNDLECDITIVGAGIAGLTTAYLLLKEGKDVAIVDAACLGSGQTARTTAHLTYMLDDRFENLEKIFGTEGLKLALCSHKEAIDLIEKIVEQENIECHFERINAYLFNTSKTLSDILEKEFDAAKRVGIQEVSLERTTLSFFPESPQMLALPLQAQFHPLEYIRGLSYKILAMGGKIFQKTHIHAIQSNDHCVATTSSGYRIVSSAMVVSTNTPINNRFIIHTKQAAYRSYVIAGLIPKGSVPKALYYDTLDPYHYIRIFSREKEDVLIVGGEDHKTGQHDDPKQCYINLEAWTKQRFPMLQNITHRWSGQIMEPIDGLAFIGKNPMEKNVFIITGDSGNGMTHGTLGGQLICNLIMKKYSPYVSLYDPARKKIQSADAFANENLNVGMQYAKWVRPAEKHSISEIPINTGAILQKKLEKIAVFRDAEDKIHACSAVCPHLGCLVNWNDAEKTWDCPCHGSLFDCRGKVMNGPAVSNLKKREI